MKPSRQLDALIHTQVMGETVTLWETYGIPGEEDKTEIKAPHYSTDIAAAWQVVEKLMDMDEDHKVTIYPSPTSYKECAVGIKYWDNSNPEDPLLVGPIYVLGVSLPHAICLSALKAVGYEL